MFPGIIVRQAALEQVSVTDFRALVRSGRLKRLFRGIYVDTDTTNPTDALVRRAALTYADRNLAAESPSNAFLCCDSAGAEWGLPLCKPARLSVSIPRVRRVSRLDRLDVHRHRCRSLLRPDGVRLAPIAEAVVQSFTRLAPDAGREMVIRSIQEGLAQASALRECVPHNLRRRRELLDLITLAGDGSHSPLEIAALLTVVRRFGLSEVFKQQGSVQLKSHRVDMDFASVEFKVNLETDGSRYHSSPKARKQDNRRDLELQRDGWHIVRALYEQVVDHPETVASALISILVARGWRARPTTLEGRIARAAVRS